jgi:hypothetical protein
MKKSKQIQNSNLKIKNFFVWIIRILNIRICFEFRASNLEFFLFPDVSLSIDNKLGGRQLLQSHRPKGMQLRRADPDLRAQS